VSILEYEARQSPALIQHDPLDQQTQLTRHSALGLASVAVTIVLAAFWASIAWLVWGSLGAAVAAIVVLVLSTFTMALLRSASELETTDPASWHPELRQAA
jgi:fatty acid desaturase